MVSVEYEPNRGRDWSDNEEAVVAVNREVWTATAIGTVTLSLKQSWESVNTLSYFAVHSTFK